MELSGLFVEDAFSSVNIYVSRQLKSVLVQSMVDSAYRLDEAQVLHDGHDREWTALRKGLDEYIESLCDLTTDSISKYIEIATAEASLRNHPDATKKVRAAVLRNIIRPGSRLLWAWMYWVVYAHPVPCVKILPLEEPDRLIGVGFPIPEWKRRHTPEMTSIEWVHAEALHVRARLRADLSEKMMQADIAIKTAVLRNLPQSQRQTEVPVDHATINMAVLIQPSQHPHPPQQDLKLAVPEVHPAAFAHSDDFRSITFRGKTYATTLKQAKIIEALSKARQSGTPELGKARLLEIAEAETSELKAIFKSSPLWQSLVVSGTRKGTYRLNTSG